MCQTRSRRLTAKRDDGEYVIPNIIYSDAYASEMVHYADLILPDTTYLERWDCISMLDRPISEADGPADSIRQPVVEPDRDVRPFQTVLLDLGAQAWPSRHDASLMARRAIPAAIPTTSSTMSARRALGPLAGFRGPRRQGGRARGAPIPNQLKAYIDNGCHWFQELPDHMKYYRHVNWDYLDWATFFGFLRQARTHHPPALFARPLQKFRLAAQGHGKVTVPPSSTSAHRNLLRSRSPSGIRPLKARW